MDILTLCKQAQSSARTIAITTNETRNEILNCMAQSLLDNTSMILQANEKDIATAIDAERGDAFIDRLRLTNQRIIDMALGIKQVATLDDPIGQIYDEKTISNGLLIKRVRVPLGVIAIIYEARPNVTADAAALCIKSGNAVILKGSRESHQSNKAICDIFTSALMKANLPSDMICFVDDTSREATRELLSYGDYIDVTIPRGGNQLKEFVLTNATMPVIASAGGTCHIFVDSSADYAMACDIIINAKCQRPSVCNALEQLLIHKDIAHEFVPIISTVLSQNGVEIRGDEIVCSLTKNAKLASSEDFRKEFCELIIAIKIVDDTYDAVNIINTNGTKHSESIISTTDENINYFLNAVDAACVYHNASTRFTDGFQFGLGAEMAISTQKLHVRGPMGLEALTSLKYVIYGNGQIRK